MKEKIRRIKRQWNIAIFGAVIICFLLAWIDQDPLGEKVQHFLFNAICAIVLFTVIKHVELWFAARKPRK